MTKTVGFVKVGNYLAHRISAGNYEVFVGGVMVRVQKRRSGWTMLHDGTAYGSRDKLTDALHDAVSLATRALHGELSKPVIHELLRDRNWLIDWTK